MERYQSTCLVKIRKILRLAGADEATAIAAFHELVDVRGCTEVRRALTALEELDRRVSTQAS